MLSKRLSKLLLDTLCDKHKQDGVLFLDCYNDIAYNRIAPTITTRISSSNHYYLMFIYEANSNTSDWGCNFIHHPRYAGGWYSHREYQESRTLYESVCNRVLWDMRAAFNPDSSGGGIFRTIKATQQNQSFANFMHTGSFGATGIIEIYESSNRMGTR